MLPVYEDSRGGFYCTVILALTTIAAAVTLSGSPVAQVEDVKEVIAAQIRIQGHECNKPLSAERDQAASQPHETVWMLRCDNGNYRVKLIPDLAAEISKID
jgi:hypothetical protein